MNYSNADIERLHNTLNEQLRVINKKPDEEKKFTNPIVETIITYNRTIHSATKMKPENLHYEKDEIIIKKAYENLNQNKLNSLKKVNATRKSQKPDFNYIKKHKRFKLDDIYKKVEPSHIQKDYAIINNKPFYKSRFKKYKKIFSPSSSNSVQPVDDNNST